MVGCKGILPYLVFWAVVSLVQSQASTEYCDINSYVFNNTDPTNNDFPVCENFGLVQSDETECSDRCYCLRSVGWKVIDDACSLKHFKQTVTYSGVTLRTWDEPTLNLDDLKIWTHAYIVLAFKDKVPQITMTHNGGVCRRDRNPATRYTTRCNYYRPICYTRANPPIDAMTVDKIKSIAKNHYHTVDCLSEEKDYPCTAIAGDINFDEKDLVIPPKWNNLKKHYGCINVINSPIKCDDLRAFVDGLRQDCDVVNEIRNSPNIESLEKCVGKTNGWSFTPATTTTEEPTTTEKTTTTEKATTNEEPTTTEKATTDKPVTREERTEPTGTNPDVVVVTAIGQKPTGASIDNDKNPNDHSNFVFNILILAIVLLLVAIAYYTISLRNKKPLQNQKDGKQSIEQMVAAQLEKGIKPELLKNLTTV